MESDSEDEGQIQHGVLRGIDTASHRTCTGPPCEGSESWRTTVAASSLPRISEAPFGTSLAHPSSKTQASGKEPGDCILRCGRSLLQVFFCFFQTMNESRCLIRPVDCELSEPGSEQLRDLSRRGGPSSKRWSSWSACSSSCDGIRHRSRVVRCPA